MRIGRRLEALLLTPLGLLLTAMILVPAGILVYYSLYRFAMFEPYGAAGAGNYVDSLTQPLYRTLAENTLRIAAPTTIVSVAGGYALAYYIAFGRSRWRGLLFALVLSALM